jgi:Family of unknown function (DUF6876)
MCPATATVIERPPWQRVEPPTEPGHTATLTCEDGNGKAVYSKAIEYTDFPLPEIALYFTNSTILLPSEY